MEKLKDKKIKQNQIKKKWNRKKYIYHLSVKKFLDRLCIYSL